LVCADLENLHFTKTFPRDIITLFAEIFYMNDKDRYIEQLEKLIVNKLLPIYDEYYELTGLPRPELNIPICRAAKRIPALLRADLRHLLRTGETQEKTKSS